MEENTFGFKKLKFTYEERERGGEKILPMGV